MAHEDSMDPEWMHTLDESDFESRIGPLEGPALVVFTADWCAPCKWLKPYLQEITETTRGRVPVFLMDADRATVLMKRFAVASVPTVILMTAGSEVDRSVGVEPDRLKSWVAPFVD